MYYKIYRILNHLTKITDIKEIFIARVNVVIAMCRLSTGTIDYKGNTLNKQQDMQTVLTKLPLLSSDMLIFIVRK